MGYKLTIGPHPAQATDPFTHKPLFDDDGVPVPLITDQKTVRLDGRVIAYISSGGVSFIVAKNKLGAVYDEALALAETVAGKPGNVSAVPDMDERETELDEEDEDE